MRYWEDMAVGETRRYGRYELTGEEIAAFATRFSPPAVAGAGADAAPGYLLCCIGMRLLVDHALADLASLGSPGVDHIDWPNLAYVGDVVSLSTDLLSARVLESRPEMGLIKQAMVVENQHGEPVARMWTNALIARREAAS